ncbi:hypothetical protein BHOIPH791_03760 [Bartonella henselae]|uniref:Uncharacterized protein n=1 Tax=Bartonella henselae (strain ATCC 49882 / DSM 28221 / CCUG 30454 / Houston 1) TaxID=283166 RepID=A0A0H3LXC0_BARHE|nr:hypothetical protein [Bartonella henselae]CAF27656.1 hypothetical protein BH08580 [Bartonella henselae str. Houston-1]OLL37763.1 hypothetical protein AT237_03335 [Bartonella henselae]OLL44086.1 hypothetical protein AT242_01570 [Bartonella henselae]OLL55356.1 hypothetical protein AT238_03800 [Bartonella henselae]OLL57203.1 hypothetical protein AT248_02795 [Bartonella henselae]
MLSNLHGIGFIRLDRKNFSESQIMIPTKERNEIDWNTVNRLSEKKRLFYYLNSSVNFIKLANFTSLIGIISQKNLLFQVSLTLKLFNLSLTTLNRTFFRAIKINI